MRTFRYTLPLLCHTVSRLSVSVSPRNKCYVSLSICFTVRRLQVPIRHIPQFLEWLVLGFMLMMSSRRECYEWWHLKEPQSNTHWWVIKVIRLFSAARRHSVHLAVCRPSRRTTRLFVAYHVCSN